MSITPPGTIRSGVGLEVWVYDVLDNITLVDYIPNCTQIQFEDQLSDVGAGKVTVDTGTITPACFAKDNLWRVTWMGLDVFAFIGENSKDIQVQASLHRTQEVAGRGIAWWLDKAKAYPAGWGGTVTNPNQSFTNVSMASILQTLLQQAHARGTLTWIHQTGWTDLVDSSGNSWSDSNSLQIQAGESFLTTLQTFAKAVPFDWHVDALGNLQLWKRVGVDRTASVKINPAGAMLSAEVDTDNTNLWDVVLVEDANQGFTEQKDAATIATHGRREQFISSSSVIDATGRADLGFQLLQQFKVPVVQKVIQFDPQIVGRRPYLDYQLGDTIGVEFPDGTDTPARTIAIAIGTPGAGGGAVSAGGGTFGVEEGLHAGLAPDVGTITEQVAVTLDFTLGQNSQSTSFDTSAITSPGGNTTVFIDNGSTTINVGTTPATVLQVVLQTFSTSFAKFHTFLEGTTSVACEATLALLFSGVGTVRTWKRQLPAGDVTISDAFMVPAIPEGTTTATLQITLSAGALTLPGGSGAIPPSAQMWFEGPSLNGGEPGSTDISIIDTIPFGDSVSPQTVTDTEALTTQTPQHPNIADTVPFGGATQPQTVTDTTPAFQLGYVEVVAAGADDGDDNSSGVWSNSATQLEAGNDGGIIFGWYTRFLIPSPSFPSTSAVVSKAFFTATCDQNDANASLVIYAEHAASPAQITSDADYNARVRTTASVTWSLGSVTSGQALTSPDLTPIIQELVAAYGNTITAIQLFIEDNSSALNAKLLIRSFENTNNDPAVFTVRYNA